MPGAGRDVRVRGAPDGLGCDVICLAVAAEGRALGTEGDPRGDEERGVKRTGETYIWNVGMRVGDMLEEGPSEVSTS